MCYAYVLQSFSDQSLVLEQVKSKKKKDTFRSNFQSLFNSTQVDVLFKISKFNSRNNLFLSLNVNVLLNKTRLSVR